MNDITHYTCPGTCGGVSAEPKVCGADICTHKGVALMPCGCVDGMHGKGSHEDEVKTLEL